MTLGQYRALVAYMNFWTPDFPEMNLDAALKDLGILDYRKDVIADLYKCGWEFSEETGLLTFNNEDGDEE